MKGTDFPDVQCVQMRKHLVTFSRHFVLILSSVCVHHSQHSFLSVLPCGWDLPICLTETTNTGPSSRALKLDLCCSLAQAQEITIKQKKGIWGSLLSSFIFHVAGLKYSPLCLYHGASLMARMVKHLPAMWETQVGCLGQEDPLEKEMATHSRTLAWKIPWMDELDRLQPIRSQRVGHNWVTSLYASTVILW